MRALPVGIEGRYLDVLKGRPVVHRDIAAAVEWRRLNLVDAEAIAALGETPRAGEPAWVTLSRRARAAHVAGRHAEAVLFWSQTLESYPGYFVTRGAERLLWNASVAAVTAQKPVTAVRTP